jgi:hypothetical protein
MFSVDINENWKEITGAMSNGTISCQMEQRYDIFIGTDEPVNLEFETFNSLYKVNYLIPADEKLFIKTTRINDKGQVTIDPLNKLVNAVRLVGSNGEAIDSLKGAISMHDADAHNVPFNEFFHEHTGVETTLAAAITPGDTSIEVVSPTGFLEGDNLQIGNGIIETTFPTITDIASSEFTLDRPIDFPFSIEDTVEEVIFEAAVVGSLGSPRAFRLMPDSGQTWHVISLTISMVHPLGGDDSKFGDLSALLNGVVLRGYNGAADMHRTLTNWKSNSEMKQDTGTINPYTDKAAAGSHGTFFSVNIKERSGAVPSINGATGDYLEVLIQDDLTDLDSIKFKAQGHLVGV